MVSPPVRETAHDLARGSGSVAGQTGVLMGLEEVRVRPVAPAHLESLIGPARTARFEATAGTMREVLSGRTVLNVSSTATGGGVAELLQTLLANVCGLGIDARWVVIEGDPEFFAITKRIHNHLYGTPGDGGALGPAERRRYEATLARNASELIGLVRPGDVVLLHDPQTAWLAVPLLEAGISVVWRCHVGLDAQNDHSRLAWDFLRPYIEGVPAFVFSRAQFAPPWMPRDRLFVIPPSIDPFSAKNRSMSASEVRRALQHVGFLGGGTGGRSSASFPRRDGTVGRVSRPVDLLGTGPPPPSDAPVVVQASRWDALKDMPGVMAGFADRMTDMGTAHLVLAGPSVDGVADDPEAAGVLDECLTTWRALPEAVRGRIHLACVSMIDGDEAAAVVNALQRHAAVVVQKSLAEAFGLTVAEAMWKGRPVVGSAVGGIVDQIIPGETGFLLPDPNDLATFAEMLAELIADPAEGDRMGGNGRKHATEHFLGDRHLEQWAEVLSGLQ
jgi:trehalose synthase